MKAFLFAVPYTLALITVVAGPASADESKKHKQGREGDHPAFLHALSDLRFARANLARFSSDERVKWNEALALADVDRAIKTVKEAAYDDGKNLAEHPPIDAKLTRPGRLHHALEALDAAHRDVSQQEDDAYVRKLKVSALKDIESAVQRTEGGLCEEGETAFCKTK